MLWWISLITDDCRISISALCNQPISKSGLGLTLASSVTGHFLDITGKISTPVDIGNVVFPRIFMLIT